MESLTDQGRTAATVAPLTVSGEQYCYTALPHRNYLRQTSMIFTTKVANAMQSIAIIIAFDSNIGITSLSAAMIWRNAMPQLLNSISNSQKLGKSH
jgi:hypothetical protein